MDKLQSATDPEQRSKLEQLLSEPLRSVARLWNLTAKDPATEPRVLQNARSPVATSPDGHWLVTASSDKIALLWDLRAKDPAANPVVLRDENVVNAVRFSPDNHWLITGSADVLPDSSVTFTARVWDLEHLSDYEHSKSKPMILKGGRAIDISSDSRWVASGSLLWDLTAKDPAGSFIALPVTGDSPTFSRDEQGSHWLVTSYREDKTLRGVVCLWNMRLDELMKLACRTAGRNLTEKEWQQYFYGQPYQKTCPELP